MPLVFAHDERLDLTGKLPAVDGVLHWPRAGGDFGRAEVWRAVAGDLLLVDRQLGVGDIAEWTTQPSPSCSPDGLVVVDHDARDGEFEVLPGAVEYVFGTPLGIVTARLWTDDTWVVANMRGCFVDPSLTHLLPHDLSLNGGSHDYAGGPFKGVRRED